MATGNANNSNKETINAAGTTQTVHPGEKATGHTEVTHVKGSKAALAQAIFDEDARKKPRKEVIARMISETGLTQSGASTYYQNMKGKAGMVNKREMVTMKVATGGSTPSVQGAGQTPAVAAK